MKIGTRVRYTQEFINSIQSHVGDLPLFRGCVSEIREVGEVKVAGVNWDNGQNMRVMLENLEEVPNEKFSGNRH